MCLPARSTLRCPEPAERCRRGQGTGDGAAPAPGLPGVRCRCRPQQLPWRSCSVRCRAGRAAGCVPGSCHRDVGAGCRSRAAEPGAASAQSPRRGAGGSSPLRRARAVLAAGQQQHRAGSTELRAAAGTGGGTPCSCELPAAPWGTQQCCRGRGWFGGRPRMLQGFGSGAVGSPLLSQGWG